MEFLVYTDNRMPPDADPELVGRLRSAERDRAQELRAAGVLKRLWRVPGRWATVALYEAPDATVLHEALASLPMWPYTDVRVEPLAEHPQEAALRRSAEPGT
jgi:muconolactone D-isomerase